MAVWAECPMCHKKQKVSNKVCHCGANLDKIKKNNTKHGQETGQKDFVTLPEVDFLRAFMLIFENHS